MTAVTLRKNRPSFHSGTAAGAAADIVIVDGSGLDVQGGALQHPGQGQGLAHLELDVERHALQAVEVLLEPGAQRGQVGAAAGEDGGRHAVAEHGQQHVLEADQLVPPGPGVVQRPGQGPLEIATDHSGSIVQRRGNSCWRASSVTRATLVSATSRL